MKASGGDIAPSPTPASTRARPRTLTVSPATADRIMLAVTLALLAATIGARLWGWP
jgi:hypothetical protein